MIALLALALPALAAPATPTVGADAKTLMLGVFGDHPWYPDNPSGQALLDGRLKVRWDPTEWLDLEVHHAVTTTVDSNSSASGFFGTGVGGQAPELIDMDWEGPSGDGFAVRGRTDRLVLTAHTGRVDTAVGRQPVTLGQGRFFAPLDLVNPFHPATVDTEYKPGVDAIRTDVYLGAASSFTVVAGYAGSPSSGASAGDVELDQLVMASQASVAFGTSELSLVGALVHADRVVGLSSVHTVSVFTLYGDTSWTVPSPDSDTQDAFLRVVFGADTRLNSRIAVGMEVYHQTIGADEPSDYLTQALTERVIRGEMWTLGHSYVGTSVSAELNPLTHLTGMALANVADPSALVGAVVSHSVSEDVDLVGGTYLGLGERPPELDSTDLFALPESASEFGMMPTMVFVQTKAYF